MRLNQILTSLESTLGTNLQVNRVSEALTNCSYHIKGHQGEWALRINNPSATLFGIDRAREHQIIKAIEREHFTVPVIAVTKDYLLTQWMNGPKFSLDSTEKLNKLISFSQTIHQYPVAMLTETKALDIRQQIQTLKNNIELPRSMEKKLASLMEEYVPASELCLCHHDWHPGNLIETETALFLIDWEYAALGDPIIDWACMCSGFDLSADFINQLLFLTSVDQDRFSNALALVEMMSILWFNQRYPKNDWQPDYQEWANRWT